MKVWIATHSSPEWVGVYLVKPKGWVKSIYTNYYQPAEVDSFVGLCRKYATKMIRGSGKKLPEHGSKTLVQVSVVMK